MQTPRGEPQHVDVLIVGAGISGIGVAHHVRRAVPGIGVAILEARDDLGGTWDLFRYPGIRSDSDLQTFGYGWRPWTGDRSIADAASIKQYLADAVRDEGLAPLIRYRRRVVSADFDTAAGHWVVEVEHTDTGERSTVTCGWYVAASGYYRYDAGYAPELPGRDDFVGDLVHPQHWPEDLDVTGRRVVVVGSGATAVTLVPAIAGRAEHVTMLQRTPTYVIPLPAVDGLANLLRRVFGDRRGHALARARNIWQSRTIYRFCQRFPDLARRLIRRVNVAVLPDGYDVDRHFSPPYEPWDQRLCVAPDGDLFRVIRAGTASVVTETIDRLTEHGVLLSSGEHLDADLIVTATGLQLQLMGGIEVRVDGEPVDLSKRVAFRGMMLSGLPNFVFVVGYTNASWTLKVDLVGEHLGRILRRMRHRRHDVATPQPPPEMPLRPLMDFGAGYVQRSMDELPRKGEGPQWQVAMDVVHDRRVLRDGPVEDDALRFSSVAERT